jgi:hypothetical protein
MLLVCSKSGSGGGADSFSGILVSFIQIMFRDATVTKPQNPAQ